MTAVFYPYDTSDDTAVFGPDPEGIVGVDILASKTELRQQVANAIALAYGECEVAEGTGPAYIGDEPAMHEQQEALDGIAHDVWESFEWIIREE